MFVSVLGVCGGCVVRGVYAVGRDCGSCVGGSGGCVVVCGSVSVFGYGIVVVVAVVVAAAAATATGAAAVVAFWELLPPLLLLLLPFSGRRWPGAVEIGRDYGCLFSLSLPPTALKALKPNQSTQS